MSSLTALAPGKINLALYLGKLRADGLHELVTVTESLSLADELTLEPAPEGSSSDEVICPGVEGPNLAAAALATFRATTGWDAPSQRITIEKRVPVAAGMGGGSADAAAVLRLCVVASGIDPGRESLLELAFGLGSDVPSQLEPGLALVTDGGRHVEQLPPPPEHGVLVVPLERQLATAEVFARADRLGLPRASGVLRDLREELRAEFTTGELSSPSNDLERAALALCPEIEPALAAVQQTGARDVLVSGSGPTVIGIFPGADGVSEADAAAVTLRERYPKAGAAVPVETELIVTRPKVEFRS